MKVYIYSSGSVEAQKLLFGHSTEGDILEVGYLVSQFVCCHCDEYHGQSHLGRVYFTHFHTKSFGEVRVGIQAGSWRRALMQSPQMRAALLVCSV